MEIPRSERAGMPPWVLSLATAAGALTVLCIFVLDQPLARALAPYQPLAFWNAGVDVLEWAILLPLWRYALPIALVAGMLAAVGVERWRIHAPMWMFVAGVHLGSRLTVNWFKDATARLRPQQWLKTGTDETFGWENGVSFPSGHVVLFASIALPIAVLFPRSRPVIAIAAVVVVFISAARVGVNEHFLSDTLAAIMLVALWMWLVGSAVRPLRSSRR